MQQSSMKDLTKIRTDVVGSLLRPAYLKQARLSFDAGTVSAQELRLIEDRAVREAVLFQEQVGLEIVTDGEFRRLNFEESFGTSVSGFGGIRADTKFYEERAKNARPLQREEIPEVRRSISDRLRLVRNLPLEEFLFVSRVAQKPAKVTLINADHYRQRFDDGRSSSVYSSADEFIADVVQIEREIVTSLVNAGCRYLQFDAPRYAAYVDAGSVQSMRQRGKDPVQELTRSISVDNDVVRGFDRVTLEFMFVAATGTVCGLEREATTPSPRNSLASSATIVSSWNMIVHARVHLSRYGLCQRAKWLCWDC
jgi:5-methyltetrahydropteroyltriglutamate--homocysteine methyltransferase